MHVNGAWGQLALMRIKPVQSVDQLASCRIMRVVFHDSIVTMQALLFLAVSVALYFLADWLLRQVERRRGAPFDNRTLIFFFLLLALALITFNAINYFFSTAPPGTAGPTPHTPAR